MRADAQTETLLTVEQIAKLLQISKTSAYALVHQQDFPTLKIGRCLRVPRAA